MGKTYVNITIPFEEIENVIAKYLINKYLSPYSNMSWKTESFMDNGKTYNIDIIGTEKDKPNGKD